MKRRLTHKTDRAVMIQATLRKEVSVWRLNASKDGPGADNSTPSHILKMPYKSVHCTFLRAKNEFNCCIQKSMAAPMPAVRGPSAPFAKRFFFEKNN
jgi:hypothetical protein